MSRIAFLLCFLFGLSLAGQQWSSLASMPTPRSDLSAVVVDQMVLVAGGCVDQVCPLDLSYCSCNQLTTKLEAFFPANGTWNTLAPLPRQRFRHGAVVIGTKMFLIGGRDIDDALITTTDVYDISSNIWTTNANMNWVQATSDNVVVNIGSTIYAIGGYDENYTSVAQMCVYTSSWDCSSYPRLLEGRGDACGVATTGSILVVGGFSDVNFCTPLDSLEIYNVSTRTWITESHLHSPRADSACAYIHGDFHVVGGEVKSNTTDCNKYDIPEPDVEFYDIENGTWTEETPIPDARFRFAGVNFAGGVLLIGGQGPVDQTTGIQPVLGKVSLLTHFDDQPSSANTLVLAWILLSMCSALLAI